MFNFLKLQTSVFSQTILRFGRHHGQSKEESSDRWENSISGPNPGALFVCVCLFFHGCFFQSCFSQTILPFMFFPKRYFHLGDTTDIFSNFKKFIRRFARASMLNFKKFIRRCARAGFFNFKIHQRKFCCYFWTKRKTSFI